MNAHFFVHANAIAAHDRGAYTGIGIVSNALGDITAGSVVFMSATFHLLSMDTAVYPTASQEQNTGTDRNDFEILFQLSILFVKGQATITCTDCVILRNVQ